MSPEAGWFRVRVSLERYFSDERARCLMAVSGAHRVRWLARRVRRTFQLPRRVALLARGLLLPPAEPLAAVLHPDELVEVIPATADVMDPARPRAAAGGGRAPRCLPPARPPAPLTLPACPPAPLTLPARPPAPLTLPACPPAPLTLPARPPAPLTLPACPPAPLTPPPPPPPPPPARLEASGERALGEMKRYALRVLEGIEVVAPAPAAAAAPPAAAAAACPHRRRTRTRRRRVNVIEILPELTPAPPAPPAPQVAECADADSTVEDVVRNAHSDLEALRRRAARVVRNLEAAPAPPAPH